MAGSAALDAAAAHVVSAIASAAAPAQGGSLHLAVGPGPAGVVAPRPVFPFAAAVPASPRGVSPRAASPFRPLFSERPGAAARPSVSLAPPLHGINPPLAGAASPSLPLRPLASTPPRPAAALQVVRAVSRSVSPAPLRVAQGSVLAAEPVAFGHVSFVSAPMPASSRLPSKSEAVARVEPELLEALQEQVKTLRQQLQSEREERCQVVQAVTKAMEAQQSALSDIVLRMQQFEERELEEVKEAIELELETQRSAFDSVLGQMVALKSSAYQMEEQLGQLDASKLTQADSSSDEWRARIGSLEGDVAGLRHDVAALQEQNQGSTVYLRKGEDPAAQCAALLSALANLPDDIRKSTGLLLGVQSGDSTTEEGPEYPRETAEDEQLADVTGWISPSRGYVPDGNGFNFNRALQPSEEELMQFGTMQSSCGGSQATLEAVQAVPRRRLLVEHGGVFPRPEDVPAPGPGQDEIDMLAMASRGQNLSTESSRESFLTRFRLQQENWRSMAAAAAEEAVRKAGLYGQASEMLQAEDPDAVAERIADRLTAGLQTAFGGAGPGEAFSCTSSDLIFEAAGNNN
eukprot:TRINITY_DN101724_c0_g1_i1.p1 TRINITY_DN101724_c0_g1~~TRINITY_DN101724_c0_g1_i1.p1  ORF type:complete len:575 (+),score=153.46 TRINITY_DN101724_c0_g1_i1:68-1792(+)